MGSRAVLWWTAIAGALLPVAFAQDVPKNGVVPRDPLELITGTASAVEGVARTGALRLLEGARNSYALRTAGRAYDLKVRFTVDSAGQTDYDGAWQMEDVFDPAKGLRWTATGPGNYSITRISVNGMLYGEETGSYIPLRLHEVRAALFDPIPSPANANRSSLRTLNAQYRGTPLTCILLSAAANTAVTAAGRRWNETEECIDPQSGLLRTHSQVPGRYYAYDYTDGPQFAGRTLPRTVIVTEAGRTVTTIRIDSLKVLSNADPALFVPTEEMKARGRPPGMGGAQRITRILGRGASAGASAQTVCVFGVVTPSGQVVEAHSLQPANPNSEAAVDAVRQMNFARPALPGTLPEQHFIFIIGRFLAPR